MLVETEINEIIRGNNVAIIVLREKAGNHRRFPVYIDLMQAASLEMAVHDVKDVRPLTHDLIVNVIHGMGGNLKRVIVDKLESVEGHGETYFAKLDVKQESNTSTWIDARPSDAIVVATKEHAPIYVDEQVLRKAGAEPDETEEI